MNQTESIVDQKDFFEDVCALVAHAFLLLCYVIIAVLVWYCICFKE